jgi:glucose-6-phosphate dehydrogenase assembly protein OpcA
VTRTLWDTTGTDVVSALIAERRVSGAVASGLALTLVAIVDERNVESAEQAATIAAAAHPCRLLIVVRRDVTAQSSRLDAEVSIGGRLGPTESVVMRMWGRLALHSESVVLPLLAPDAPVLTWWHDAPPKEIGADALGVLAGRRVTDCAEAPDPLAALRQRAVDYAPGDTDLAWSRTTPWRSLLASAFDSLDATPVGARISAEAGNPSAALLGGWLCSRLGLDAAVEPSGGPGITEVGVDVRSEDDGDGFLGISRPDGRLATLSRSGQRDRALPLLRRELGDLLAEEVRRLDADEVYAEALGAACGVTGLSQRAPNRRHVWRDPAWEAESA